MAHHLVRSHAAPLWIRVRIKPRDPVAATGSNFRLSKRAHEQAILQLQFPALPERRLHIFVGLGAVGEA
jgi:hypothetical protein